MKKLLVTTLVIFSSLICSAYAKEVNQEQDPVIQSQIEHQRIKLGIEELRKKYPISLLDEKKKHYKAGQKVNIDDYSEAEIKAAFLNADQNFVSRKKIKGRARKKRKNRSSSLMRKKPKKNLRRSGDCFVAESVN